MVKKINNNNKLKLLSIYSFYLVLILNVKYTDSVIPKVVQVNLRGPGETRWESTLASFGNMLGI